MKVKVAGITIAVVAGLACQYAFANCGACGKHAEAEKPAAACSKESSCCKSGDSKACAAALTTGEIKALLDSGKPVVLLDARTGQFDDGKRLPGAKGLSPEATEEQALKAAGAKDAQIVAYCSGLKCPASKKLAERLAALGFTNVRVYPEGMEGWKAAGGNVEDAQQ